MKAWEIVQKGWCQKVYAQDADGNEVDYLESNARSWCIEGALFLVYGDDRSVLKSKERQVRRAIEEQTGKRSENSCTVLTDWNDSPDRQQSEVVRLLKELDL